MTSIQWFCRSHCRQNLFLFSLNLQTGTIHFLMISAIDHEVINNETEVTNECLFRSVVHLTA